MALTDGDTQPIRVPSDPRDGEFVCADCSEIFNALDPPGQRSNRFCPRCVSGHYPPETKPFAELLEEEGGVVFSV